MLKGQRLKVKGKKIALAAMLCLAFFGLAFSSEAKTITFEDQSWDVEVSNGNMAPKLLIRNDASFQNLANNSLTGAAASDAAFLFDTGTAARINEITDRVNQAASDAKLVMIGKFAKEFDPGQNGQGVDVFKLRKLLASTAQQISLPVVISTPTNKLSDTNNLGINELVAVGESDFAGSPRNRIHNIQVGADKFNGLIIDQGEEFSFNKFLGDVDGENGFLPELVIKRTGLVAEFGGGLCQVSSTAFRGAMNAGVPITERRNHSFAVQYYAPQGTDATIYPGVVDLKFKNDLSSAMLIRARVEGNKLYFEYYGTKDDRIVAVDDPVQYDHKSNGSLKATWSRKVTHNGETTEQIFRSTYQPPALFQRVEQAATPNPETSPEVQQNQPSQEQPVNAATN